MNTSLSAEERAEALLKDMTIEEKMAQINCIFPWSEDIHECDERMPYGIGQVSCLLMRTIHDLHVSEDWQRDMQRHVMENSPHHIPAAFHMEGTCGSYFQNGASFPTGIARASSFDPVLEEKIGRTAAHEMLAGGVTQLLGPVMDVSRDPRLGRLGETYGEDPSLAAAMASHYVKGAQNEEVNGRHIECEAKHFLGFHASLAGIHGANVEMGERQLKEVYAKPFQAAVTESGLRGVMPCYCSINGISVSASRYWLTEFLRKEMGFDGVVGADYGAVSGVYHVQHMYESEEEAGLACLTAGMDIEQPGCVCYNDRLKEMFESGNADMEILNTAVKRVLSAKFRMGLFEHPFADMDQFEIEGKEELSLQSALESIVLLKNDGVLPFKEKKMNIALIGSHADNARILFGGYTRVSMEEAVYAAANSLAGVGDHEGQNSGYERVPGTDIQYDLTGDFDQVIQDQKPGCMSILQQLLKDFPDSKVTWSYGYDIAGDDSSHFKEALQVCQYADVVLLMLGGKNGSGSIASMGEGVDGTDINLPVCQDRFIEEASKLGKPLVGLHFNGRPISSDTADEKLNAILECWNPAEKGAEAVSMVLRGEYNPSGKMPVTTARNAGQVPVFYNHDYGSSWHQGESIGFANYVDCSHMPRYCFGHGLSYTEFAYSDMRIEEETVSPEEEISLSFNIENTGGCSGTETVQVYVKDEQASVVRPVQELIGFRRVYLKAGEKKTVRFSIPANALAFLDQNMKWKVEKGMFTFLIGSSSLDIRLSCQIYVNNNLYIEGRDRTFYVL